MDVDSFIAKYEAEWRSLESACSKGAGGLAGGSGERISEVVRLYLRASGHLAEVRARYRDARLEAYLNGLVAKAHAAIYSAKPRTVQGALQVFGARYRRAYRDTTKFILVAAGIMFGVAAASWLVVANSAGARAGITPAEARDFLARSGGTGATDTGPPPGLSTVIFVNNVRVALLAFALGVTLAGVVYLLVQNGLMLGVIGGSFAALGKAGAFLVLVIPHGALELMAICIAGGAGLRIGWAWVVPGDRSRSRALRDEAASAVLVAVGIIPAFLIAAIIEGFVSYSGFAWSGIFEAGLGILVTVGYLAFLYGRPAAERELSPEAQLRAALRT